jgi:hypothetical protein
VPALHLPDVSPEVYQRLLRQAEAHQRSPEGEALALIEAQLGAVVDTPPQAELLAQLKQRSFVPPPGTPDSVELLREDRAR